MCLQTYKRKNTKENKLKHVYVTLKNPLKNKFRMLKSYVNEQQKKEKRLIYVRTRFITT